MQNLTNFPLNYIAFVYTHIFLSFIEILLHVCRQKETGWCFLKLMVQQLVSHSWKVKVKVAQWYLTLCDSMDYRVHGILQARILECTAFPFSRGSYNLGIKPRPPTMQLYQLSHKDSSHSWRAMQNIQNATILREGYNWLVVNFVLRPITTFLHRRMAHKVQVI